MKKNISRLVLQEVIRDMWKIRMLRALLGASIVYLSVYTFTMLFTLPTWKISAAFAGLYLLTELVSSSTQNPLIQVEKRYPDLDEELRTVRDSFAQDNELVTDLRKDVFRKARKYIDMGDFVDFRQLTARVLSIFFLSFTIILIASLNVRIVDAGEVYDLGKDFLDDLKDQTIAAGREEFTVVQGDGQLTNRFKKLAATAGINSGDLESGEIFGDAQLAELGGERLTVEIRPTDFEVSLDNFEAVEKKDFQDVAFSGNVESIQSLGLEETINIEEQAIVKRYFDKLAQE